MYYKSVGRNATLIIGLTPDDKGLLPQPDVDRLKEFGLEISSRFNLPLGTSSSNKSSISFKSPTKVNHVIIQEDIRLGENIRSYQVEGLKDGKWILLSKGKSIGHKRIEKFKTVLIKKIRLKIIKTHSKAVIKNFKAYFVKE